ncbi:unnamed protein product [Cylindrotheca closterium]|uniref:Peptidase M11 gametolysin domain-containing protein n=1 Tax=Cylindrotheca closterium TaxID=2856 RepID=A0AAD2G749_9STRA|nr:unnamed protein product [Cylindrotheca closterium]
MRIRALSSLYYSALLLLTGTLSVTNSAGNPKFYEGSTASFDGIECLSIVTENDGAHDSTSRLLLACLTDDYQLLGVPVVNAGWINQMMKSGRMESGKTRMRFPAGTKVNSFLLDRAPESFDNADSSDEEDIVRNRRRLSKLKRIGIYELLSVRIVQDGAGKTTTHTAADLQQEVLSLTDVNIRTQTAACSFDQLILNPATGGLISGGVAEITTTVHPGNGNLDDPVQYNQFLGYINNILGQLFVANQNQLPADFIHICLPPDTLAGTQSLGFFNSFLSVFNSAVCTYTSYNMHEFGHNLDLNHSSDVLFTPGMDSQFGDQVGYMGASYAEVHGPEMCFNPAKSFQLDWYHFKTNTCTPMPCVPCEVDLGGFVSYNDPNIAFVLMKIQDPMTDVDHYLTYNNATGFNSGTKEGINQVVINTQASEGLEANFSQLVGLLDAGMSTTFSNTYNGTNDLVVEVLSIVDGVASVRASTGVCTSSNPGTIGDPHFRTWRNEHFEYHGQCDLILVKDPTFAFGKGLEVQIRTKLIRYWSYIKSAVIRIGSDILEVQGDAEMKGIAKYWFNLEYQKDDMETIGGFPVNVHIRSERKRIVTIDLDSVYPEQKIVISTWKEFVKVDFVNPTQESFGNSVGMLGNFHSGKTYARDGQTVLDDFWQLGEEWQVLPSDDMLFYATEYPQFPEKCLEPEEAQGDRRRRQLQESNVSEEEAEAACSQLKDPLSIKDCVYDILATQDLDMVGAF